MEMLKLFALDQDDISVVSAHLQDSVLKAGDIHWLAAEKRLVIGLNRFDWEAAQHPETGFRRRRTALRFERVLAVKCRGLSPNRPDDVLNLLAIEFADGNPPSGVVTLQFSGGAAMRLEVECLECEIADLGPSWTTVCCPGHPGSGGTAAA